MTLQEELFPQPTTRSEIRPDIRQYEPLSQGAEANHKGNELEKQVKGLFTSRGVIVVPFEKYRRNTNDLFHDRSLVQQFEYPSVYGSEYKRRIDFVYLHGQDGPRVAIECKVQDTTGSADEKLPGLYFETRKWQFVEHVWFVLSGDGFRKCYERWLLAPGDLKSGKNVRVFTNMDSLRVPVKMLVEQGDAMGGRR